MPEVNWTYPAQFERIVDGDTLILTVDNGFRNRESHSFRLLDVNTPEIFTKDAVEKEKGYEAMSHTFGWIQTHQACSDNNWQLTIVTQKDKQTFNRYIADVFCAGCDDWLNAHLRLLGYNT